jgi:hypothetical protein
VNLAKSPANSATLRLDGLKTINELNDHKHWRTRHRRSSSQKDVVYCEAIRQAVNLAGMFPCRVSFTRIAPGNGLDPGDGLNSSFKFVRDAVCNLIGVDDRHRDYVWSYHQRRGAKGEYGVEVTVERIPGVVG